MQEESHHLICTFPWAMERYPCRLSLISPGLCHLGNAVNMCSKQIISTQKEYDFLESLTAGIPLPPSRPATPPPSTTPHHPRRRRKTSPSNSTAVDSATDAPPKRKRRSANKEAAEDVLMKSVSPTRDAKQEHDHEASSSGGHRGWFDVVMGSNEQDSSEDEGAKRRKYVS